MPISRQNLFKPNAAQDTLLMLTQCKKYLARLSLEKRLSVFYTLVLSIFLLITLGMTIFSVLSLTTYQHEQIIADSILDIENELLSHNKLPYIEFERAVTIENYINNLRWPDTYPYDYIRVFSTQTNTIIAETHGMSTKLPLNAFSDAKNKTVQRHMPSGKTYLLHTASLKKEDNKAYLIQVALDITNFSKVLQLYYILLGLFTIISIFLVHYLSRWMAKKTVSGISQLIDKTHQLSAECLDQRIDLDEWPTEIRSLATVFNDMLARIESDVFRLNHYSSILAHELRTPLHNLQLQAEVTLGKDRTPIEYQTLLTSMMDEFQHLSSLVNKLLQLAKIGQKDILQLSYLSIDDELKNIMDFFSAAALDKNITIRYLPSQLELLADITLFKQAIHNLLSNAMEHTHPDGMITIQASQIDNFLVIHIKDSGTGIPEARLAMLATPYHLATQANKDSHHLGLGLPIVNAIMKAHDGQFDILSDPTGTCVTLKFPNDRTVI